MSVTNKSTLSLSCLVARDESDDNEVAKKSNLRQPYQLLHMENT